MSITSSPATSANSSGRNSPNNFPGYTQSSTFHISNKFQFLPPNTLSIQEGGSTFLLNLDTASLDVRVTQVGSVIIKYNGDCVSELGSLKVKTGWFSSKVVSVGPASIERGNDDKICTIIVNGETVFKADSDCTIS